MTSIMSSSGDPEVGGPTEEALALLLAPSPTGREEYVQRQLESARTWGSPAAYDEGRIREVQGEAYDRAFHPAGQARQLQAIVASPDRTEAHTLVIHGDQDRLVDISGGRRVAEVVPGARFEVIEGMGHDYPPMFWDRMVELIAEHAGLRP
jgi:pimeloyl-ACP methyl ester carboxylesterase